MELFFSNYHLISRLLIHSSNEIYWLLLIKEFIMKRHTVFDDTYESTIEKHPYLEDIDIDDTLQDNELKFFFILGRHIYTKNGEIIFDTDFYTKTYNFHLENEKDPSQFFNQQAMRLMSLHTIITKELLPFFAIGLWNRSLIKKPMMNLPYDEFWIFDNKDKWDCIINDLDILEKNIRINSAFQKALIWYTMAKQSKNNLETFMNLYRFIEILSEEYHQNIDEKLNSFIKTDLKMFDQKTMKRKFRISSGQKIESYLKSQCIQNEKIKKIIAFRHKIAHGEDYSLEFNKNLILLIEEMFEITILQINRKIKKMNINDLGTPSFLMEYTLVIEFSERKIALLDLYDLDCYSYDWNFYSHLGFIKDKEELSKFIQSIIDENNIKNQKICDKLIQNFGKILNY